MSVFKNATMVSNDASIYLQQIYVYVKYLFNLQGDILQPFSPTRQQQNKKKDIYGGDL